MSPISNWRISFMLFLNLLFAPADHFTFRVFGFFAACALRPGRARGLGAVVTVVLCVITVVACNVREAILLGCGGRRALFLLAVKALGR